MRHYIQGVKHFKRLAERAGDLLFSLPASILNCYPPELRQYERYLKTHAVKSIEPSDDPQRPLITEYMSTYDAILPPGSSDEGRWMGFLYWLAWRGERDLGFRAERQSWSGSISYPYFADRSDFDKYMTQLPPALGGKAFEESRVFYSTLEDVFICSALAINHIQSKLTDTARRPLRLFIDDIESFNKVRAITPAMVSHHLKGGFLSISEDDVQSAFEQILEVPFHRKDWGGEINDLSTANVIVDGSRCMAAFLLKGPGIGKKEMNLTDCGKRGDQVVRLFSTPAQLFVVQYVGPIADTVVKDLEGKVTAARAEGKEAQFLVIDGQDTARLLHAYRKL